MFYGWESEIERAENYLEDLWAIYPTVQVIELKNQFVAALGINSEAFDARWLKEKLELEPNNADLAIPTYQALKVKRVGQFKKKDY